MAGSEEKKSTYSAARYVGRIKISKIQKAFLEVLKREARHLLDESHEGKLSAESSKKLMIYLKLIKDLGRNESGEPTNPTATGEADGEADGGHYDHLSTEELKKLATKPQQGGQDV